MRELTFDVATESSGELVVEGARAAMLVDPLRWRILESLGAGRSVADLSETLGVTDARITYHAARLAETGVVRFEPGPDPRARRCVPSARHLVVQEPEGPVATPAAFSEAVFQDFNQAFREFAEGMFVGARQVATNHNRSRLSEEQAAEFNRRLVSLIEEYFPPGKGDRAGTKYGFYAVLTPIDLHPHGD